MVYITLHSLPDAKHRTAYLLQASRRPIGLAVAAIVITAQCTLVRMRGLGIACRLSVRLSVCLSVCL